MNNRQNGS